MSNIYRTQEEITNLAADTGVGGSIPRLSDLRTAKFGTARRSEHIAAIKSLASTPGAEIYWHDTWEDYLRDKSINNSEYVEEERGIFHRTSSY